MNQDPRFILTGIGEQQRWLCGRVQEAAMDGRQREKELHQSDMPYIY